jgi:2-hydroxycyclohexanecarboxyl-CoA dehydrogenase
MRITLNGKTALISGSTTGIGREIALAYAEHGADVIVNGRTEDDGEELVNRIEQNGVRATFAHADITDAEAVSTAVDEAAETMDGIDIVVANGAVGSGPSTDFFRDMPPEDYSSMTANHYLSRLYVINAALDYLIEASDGRVVAISSDAGRVPTPGEVVPGGAAAAVQMATRALAQEFARWDITVNGVAPTVVEGTDLLDEITDDGAVASVFESALDKQTFPVEPADVAEIVLFLTGSPATRPVTGQTLSMTGGVAF